MKITVCQDIDNYRKDSLVFLLYDIMNKPFLIFISIYFFILLVSLLNKNDYINLYPKTFELLASSLGYGLLAMSIYSVFHLVKSVIVLYSKNTSSLSQTLAYIELNKDNILIHKENDSYVYEKKWKSFKDLIVINKTIFLIPFSKKDTLIRINKKDIIQGEFKEILLYIKSLMKEKR